MSSASKSAGAALSWSSSSPAPSAAPTAVAVPTGTPAEPATATAATDKDGAEAEPRRRGWKPIKDGRFRIALTHHHASSDDDTGAALSSFTNAAPEDLSGAAAASSLCEKVCRALSDNARCNECRPGEPHIEVCVEASLVNAINSAYTSTGYPFVVTAGSTRGAVYGSFIDLSNPSLSSLELPPPQSIVVSPSYVGDADRAPAHGLTEMDTLLAIRWSRGDRIMKTAEAAPTVAVAAAAQAKQTPPTIAAGAAGSPYTSVVARTIAHHLSQFPEGIHAIHSSPALRQLLVEGTLPTTLASTPSAPVNAAAHAPASASGGAGSRSAAAAAPSTTTSTAQELSNAEANVPPLPTPPQSNAPVQHTLVSASTFNHISVYFVAHQDGKLLYTAPIQSLSASIATRKVTAHQLILVGREEVDALVEDPFTPFPTMPPRRTRIAFAHVPVAGEEAAVFFASKTSRFVGADARKKAVAAAPVRFSVEPHLLIGNQNGDIFLFSLLQERIVQHLNYSAGRPSASASIASGSKGAGSKLVCSPVSCIAEVQNGIEKKVTRMVESAAMAKRNRRRSFGSDGIPTGFNAVAHAAAPSHYYYDVPPSLYAVGFDDGQMLIVGVTCEGGWMLRHLNNHHFGMRPIHSIAVRVPSFYARLWTSYLPPITFADRGSKSEVAALPPITTLITVESALIVHEEEQLVAAISCNGGSIALVRLPGMEIISSVAPTAYNAVGEILALQWTATSPRYLLTPDILVASGEDDTMTAFQLLTQLLVNTSDWSHHNGNDNVSRMSSTESVPANARLRILEKKQFHRSWVSRLNLMPVVVPAATANAKDAGRSNSGGMPQYLGVCLVASSYDHRTSFWPYMFSGQQRRAGEAEGPDSANAAASAWSVGEGAGSVEHADSLMLGLTSNSVPFGTISVPDRYVLVDGPTTAYPLHPELVIDAAAAGAGTSFFLTTVCCRGKLKFWSVQVKV
ncbi:conserved hypothetical protein [Leishmania infantum JPCM5]|uniref:Uncharacterized protein n=2 Tax=Leishmania infantum TaxID=5671 RepID=A4HRI1_LEIIN|nr:conserved hypothetical protein [Leishmania infantum JPCM5]CAC9436767.1 hypothetical_protein_-_conserved [Leishmania infantum]CAM65211.1 conserved hypothetical protein [Leishmania infantum JPCM5]SUZ38598.1 hypothetical_protein_-_conserved [Leishmania infantum]|eukprot:XP_001462673.1 conserved hypothetical protein [Leishmania infantum JPCM5]